MFSPTTELLGGTSLCLTTSNEPGKKQDAALAVPPILGHGGSLALARPCVTLA
jgi:hypothetical protein